MSVTADYVLHGINTPSDFLSQISNASVNSQMQVMHSVPAGLPYPLFIYNLTQNPDFTFDCEQVKALLDLCTVSNAVSLGDISGGNTDFYFKAVTNKATRVADATTSHIRFRAAEAVLVPLTLTASNDSPASISARIVCLYDGTNEPFVPASGIALAGTPVAEDHFVVGPVSINTVALNGVQDISINFGIDLIERRSDGELYITFLAVREQRPSITIRTLTSAFPTYGLNGTALTALSVYLRKCAKTARVANGTAEHIVFTATSGLIVVDSASGGANNEGITTIRIELSAADATSYPLSLDTTSTIT